MPKKEKGKKRSNTKKLIVWGMTAHLNCADEATSVERFLRRDGSPLSALPRFFAPMNSLQPPPVFPTSLDMDFLLRAVRIDALSEAQSRFVCKPDPTDARNVEYIATKNDGASKGAVIAIAPSKGSPCPVLFHIDDDDPYPFVSKVAILEKMPKAVARAHRCLIEMYTSIASTKTVDMVSLDSVRNASRVLFARALEQAEFDSTEATTPLLPVVVNEDHAMTTPDFVWKGSSVESAGESYLDSAHLVAAVRLLAQIRGTQKVPASYGRKKGEDEETTVQRWMEEVDEVFSRFVEEARDYDVAEDNVTKYRPPHGPRMYGHQRNDENINEVVAGVRASLMYHSRTAVAFTPIIDYFMFRAEKSNSVVLHIVSPRHHGALVDALRNTCRRTGPTLDSIFMVRSVLAQVLLSLEAAQYYLRFTHYDLHGNNVMLNVVGPHDPERSCEEGVVWQYVRPGDRGTFSVLASDSEGHSARIIDYGRSRCDDPRYPGNNKRASYLDLGDTCAPCERFDASVDMRTLAHDIVIYGIYSWRRWLVLADKGQCVSEDPEVDAHFKQMLSVLDDMSGVRWWNGWNTSAVPHLGYRFHVGGTMEPPASFMSYIDRRANNVCTDDVFTLIRRNEFIMRRPITEHAVTPKDVLDMTFFAAYQDTDHATTTIAVANASRAPPVRVAPSVPRVADNDLVQSVAGPKVYIDLTQGEDASNIVAEDPPGSSKKRRHAHQGRARR